MIHELVFSFEMLSSGLGWVSFSLTKLSEEDRQWAKAQSRGAKRKPSQQHAKAEQQLNGQWQLKQPSKTFKYTKYEGRGHDIFGQVLYTEDIYSWLFSHRKP